MATKYLYIDDDQNAHGIVKYVENSELNFDIEEPRSWNDQIEYLIENKNINNYDGLLLDLKLEFTEEYNTSNKNDNHRNKQIKFTGADLAQAIRTKIKSEDSIEDLPIFLCSTDNGFMKYFDRTSLDLFDKKLDKTKDFSNQEKTRQIFIEYSAAYKKLNQIFDLEKLLDIKIDDNEELSILKAEFQKCKTSHEKLYLLDRFVLQESGILINENLLAIRLGINIKESDHWENFKADYLVKYKYEGILSNLYNRWWNQELIEDFKYNFKINLKVLESEKRVKAINEFLEKYQLSPIEKMDNQSFTTYWYECYLSDNPLDVLDGLKIMNIPRFPWLDQNYISKEYLLSEDRDREKIMELLGPSEKDTFRNLK